MTAIDDDRAERIAITSEPRRSAPAARPKRVSDVRPLAAPPPSRLTVLAPESIYAPLPPPVYTVGGLLRRGDLALIVAFGSSLKTWMLADLITATASGGSWLGRFPCAQGPALYLDWESGEEEARRRLQAVARGRGLHLPVPGVGLVTMPDLYFTSPDFETELERAAQGRAVVAFDSLAAGSIDVDENDARFARGLQIAKRVAARTNASMVVLHHSRKDGGETDERQSVRGSGAIFAAADVVVSLRRFGDEEDVFTARQTKSRGGRRVDPFVVRVSDVPGGVSVSSADAAKSELASPSSSLAAKKTAILDLLGKDATLSTKNDVARRVRGERRLVLAALSELIERGEVVHHMGALRPASEVAT